MLNALVITEPDQFKTVISEAVREAVQGLLAQTKSQQATAPEMLTQAEAMAYLRISKSTFINLKKRGLIKASQPGGKGRHLFAKADLIEFVNSQAVEYGKR